MGSTPQENGLINEDKQERMSIQAHEQQQQQDIAETLRTLPLDKYIFDNSSVTVSPERGATLPSLVLDGVEIFYNDAERRNNPEKNVREGFWMGPQAGPFTKEQNEKYGYNLKQHGFLRDIVWKRKEDSGKNNEVQYEVETNEDTLKQFPHKFAVSQKVAVEKNKARISLNIRNDGKENMSFAPGNHTYYKVSPDQKERIVLSENMGVSEEEKLKWIAGGETIEIPNPGSCEVTIPGIGKLQLDFDPKFGNLRLRTEKDKGFVCIEPITCHPSKWEEGALEIESGEHMDVGFSVTLVEKE